jgi:predicted CopG family antitoxin
MEKQSTILLRKDVIEMLKKARDHPRETYNEVIEKMARIFIKMKERNQYDEFLHKIQQSKMREIWDNKEDSDWENA